MIPVTNFNKSQVYVLIELKPVKIKPETAKNGSDYV